MASATITGQVRHQFQRETEIGIIADQTSTEEFLIKWNNYSYTENTWEPIEHLDGCDAAMEAFRVCTLVCYEFSDFSHKWWQNGPKAIRTVPIKPATEDNDDSS